MVYMLCSGGGLGAQGVCWSAGNSGLSWPDVLLGSLPNVYIYACNNPSESILAKRRGYGTIVSHNVPPYARCGPLLQVGTDGWSPIICGLLKQSSCWGGCQ